MAVTIEWLQKQLVRSHKHEEKYRKKAKETYDIYSGKGRANTDFEFNILWANTETQRPALYSSTPKPNVVVRYYLDNPVARDAATLIERAILYATDPGNGVNFDCVANACATDFLVIGRCIARVKYVPTFKTSKKRIELNEDEDGNVYRGVEMVKEGVLRDATGYYMEEDIEEVVWEEVIPERICYEFFRYEPESKWDDVSWVAYGTLMSRTQIKETYRKDDVPLNYDSKGEYRETSEDSGQYALVWRFCYKPNRTCYDFVEGYGEILDKKEDPLQLQDFFDCPAPAYMLYQPDSLIPTPEYALYEDQAEELNRMSARIAGLMTAIKLVGIGAGDFKNTLQQLRDAQDGDIISVEDWRAALDKGGIKGIMEWLPIEDMVNVVQTLIRERADLIAQIFELTGISDIQRGATDPRETKGSQVLKAGFATRRLLPKQQEIQRFFRDLYRLMAEVMIEHFSPERLQEMTGIKVTPEILALLKNDGMRGFRIDIETDSTIAPDEQRDKEGIAEFIGAISKFGQAFAPLVQQNPSMSPIIGQILLWALRRFRVGREVEQDLQKALNAPPPPPQPDPETQAKVQLMQMEAQNDKEKAQMDLQKQVMEMKLDQQRFVMEMQQEQMKFQQEMQMNVAELKAKLENQRLESQAKAYATTVQASQNRQRAGAGRDNS